MLKLAARNPPPDNAIAILLKGVFSGVNAS
jgi:hypothetical protein